MRSDFSLKIVRPFLTRKFFKEILGLEGSKISWEKNRLFYEEILKPKFSWRQEEIVRGNFGIT